PVVTAGEGPVGFGPVAMPGPVRAFAAAVPGRVPSPERVVPSAEEVPVVKAVVAPRGKSRKPRVKDRGREVAPEVEGVRGSGRTRGCGRCAGSVSGGWRPACAAVADFRR